MSTTYGYARVSSKEQNNDRQIIALNQFGVDRIFIDYQSGKNFDRPQYKKPLRKLKAKDVFLGCVHTKESIIMAKRIKPAKTISSLS